MRNQNILAKGKTSKETLQSETWEPQRERKKEEEENEKEEKELEKGSGETAFN